MSYAQAVAQGKWLLIEDLNLAPPEVLAALVPLLSSRQLHLPQRAQVIRAAPGFQLLASITTAAGPVLLSSSCLGCFSPPLLCLGCIHCCPPCVRLLHTECCPLCATIVLHACRSPAPLHQVLPCCSLCAWLYYTHGSPLCPPMQTLLPCLCVPLKPTPLSALCLPLLHQTAAFTLLLTLLCHAW